MPASKPPPRDLFELPGASASLRALARRGVVHRYPKDTILIHEGDIGDTIYIILEGRLRVLSSDPVNDREVTYGTYGPGQYVGEMGLDGGRRSASVVSDRPCTCSLITRPTLEAHLLDDPRFAFELINNLIRRARDATLSTRRMALNDVYGRLKAFVESNTVTRGDGTSALPEYLTQKAIASHLGCRREMVAKLEKDLERGGYIDTPRGAPLVLLRPLPARW